MVSFIITAYNAEKSIKRAINSIVSNQVNTSIEYEIIIIDDGSTDKTEEVINKGLVKVYEKQINLEEKELKYICNGINILYIKTKNGGVSKARNTGVKNAKGEYIIFVDSDDYISSSLLKDIENYIEEGIELIKWNPIFVDDNGKELKKEKVFSFDKCTGIEGFDKLFGKDNLISCLWNYAIKKSLIPRFPEGRYHEDFRNIPLIILNAKSMCLIDKYEYYYVQTENSIMRGCAEEKQRKKAEDMLKNFDELLMDIKEMKLPKNTDENIKIFLTNSLTVILPELTNENKEFFAEELRKRKISQYIKIRNPKQLIKKQLMKMKGY